METLEELRSSRKAYAVSFMAFVKIYARQPDMLVCFFEGHDVKYYGARLAILRPEILWQGVNCGGKDAVLRLYGLITAHPIYGKARVAFFIDSDYRLTKVPDDPARLFATACYSVENLYVSPQVFADVVQSEFQLPRHPDDEGYFARCAEVFEKCLNDFLEKAKILDAWVFAQRRKEATERTGRVLKLDGLSLAQLFEIKLEGVRATYNTFDLETRTGCPTAVSEEEITKLAARTPVKDRRCVFRGKFLTFFMRVFVCALADDAANEKPLYFPEKRKRTLRPSDRNFLSELSQYAETPDEVRAFIMKLPSP
jgi:hypothetical protein